MKKLLLLFTVVMACLVFVAPASATPWQAGNSADDETGPHIVVVRDNTSYQDAYLWAIQEWNKIDNHYNSVGKGVRFVRDMNTDKPVELLVQDYYSTTDGFHGKMYFRDEPYTDIVMMNDYYLTNSTQVHRREVALHEFGHSIGGTHHDCTSYWQQRTIMVGGCELLLESPGSHDWYDWYQRWIVQFQ